MNEAQRSDDLLETDPNLGRQRGDLFETGSIPALIVSQGLTKLLAVPEDTMNQDQKVALRNPSQHFRLGEDQDRDSTRLGRGRVRGVGDLSQRKRKRSPRNPWQRFMTLEALVLAPEIEVQIKRCGRDAGKFLEDDGLLKNGITEYSSETISDAFLACYKYTAHLIA